MSRHTEMLPDTWRQVEAAIGGRYRDGQECPAFTLAWYHLAVRQQQGAPTEESDAELLQHLQKCPVCRHTYAAAVAANTAGNCELPSGDADAAQWILDSLDDDSDSETDDSAEKRQAHDAQFAQPNFLERYREAPDLALAELQTLLFDERALQQRLAFLEAWESSAKRRGIELSPPSVTSWDRLIDVIGQHGPVPALEAELVTLDELAAVTCHRDALVRIHERLTAWDEPAVPQEPVVPQKKGWTALTWPAVSLSASGAAVASDSEVELDPADANLRYVRHTLETNLLDLEHDAWPEGSLVQIESTLADSAEPDWRRYAVMRAGYRRAVVRNVRVPSPGSGRKFRTELVDVSQLSPSEIERLPVDFRTACEEDPAAFPAWRRWAKKTARRCGDELLRRTLQSIVDAPPPPGLDDAVVAHG